MWYGWMCVCLQVYMLDSFEGVAFQSLKGCSIIGTPLVRVAPLLVSSHGHSIFVVAYDSEVECTAHAD
jgi:hypothetical protein